MIHEKHAFRSADLIAGHVALDFINTATGRNTASPRDWLDAYPALLAWARLRQDFTAGDLDALARVAARDPVGAGAALARAIRFREALCRVLYAILDGRTPDADDQAELERTYRRAMRSAMFEWSETGCRLAWTVESSALDLILHVVGAHALQLCAHADTDRMRICAGDNCGWVFLDTSRNGRRRWCDMATCGNVAKARRHYTARTRG